MQENPYHDIIDLSHHVSSNRPHMALSDRAAQFAPFAALVGYEEAIDETARLTEERRELGEDERERLDRRLRILCAKIDERPHVEITYFMPDEWKNGGSYVRKTGCVAMISLTEKALVMEGGTVIRLEDIVAIAGTIFDDGYC